MNERIRELAEQQAGAILMDLVMPDSGMPERVKWNVGITSEHLEKFAELIVRECMMLVEGFEITQEVALDEYVDYEASAVLKEHFGVEE